MTTPALPTAEPRRFIDFQLSLQAVIAGAVSIAGFMLWMGWQAAQQTNNTEQLKVGIENLEKRFDDRDTKADLMRERMSSFDRTTDNLKLRVDALERVRK